MRDRRRLLKSLLAGFVLPPLTALGAGSGPPRLAGPALAGTAALSGTDGAFFVVDGWILTGRDLAGLDLAGPDLAGPDLG